MHEGDAQGEGADQSYILEAEVAGILGQFNLDKYKSINSQICIYVCVEIYNIDAHIDIPMLLDIYIRTYVQTTTISCVGRFEVYTYDTVWPQTEYGMIVSKIMEAPAVSPLMSEGFRSLSWRSS